jgi:hypothetical protein
MRTQEAVQKAVQNEYNNTPERYFLHINHPEQPTTYARLDVLGNRCSIHLSYGAIGFKHTTYKQLSMSKTAVPKLTARIGIARFSKRKPTIITGSEAVWLRFYRDGGKRHQSEGRRIPVAEKQRVPYSRRRFGRCH